MGISKKLENQGFLNNASPEVVEKERKKMADGNARILALEETIKKLKNS